MLLRCGLHESENAKIKRFLNGLNNDIYDVLCDVQYNSLHDLFTLACDIKNEIEYERQQSTKIEPNVCVAEIQHHDTQHIEGSFATNHTEDIESNNERDNTLTEDEHCINHVYTDNDMGEKITRGEKIFVAPNLTTVHAIIEQFIVEHFSDIPLSLNYCLAAPCEKERCDDSSIISMPQLMNKNDLVAPEPITYTENKHFSLLLLCMMS